MRGFEEKSARNGQVEAEGSCEQKRTGPPSLYCGLCCSQVWDIVYENCTKLVRM